MKKQTLLILLVLASIVSFGQAKKDSVPQPKTPVIQKYSFTGTADQWQVIFDIVRHNPKMTGDKIEETIEYLTKNLVPVTDSTQKK